MSRNIEVRKRWENANRTQMLLWRKNYLEKHKAELKKKRQAYYQKNRRHLLAISNKFYADNSEEIKLNRIMKQRNHRPKSIPPQL